MEVKRLKRCHWPGCNSSNSQAKKFNFFYFPRDERALKWLEVMRSHLLRSRASPPTILYISRGLRICHIHFSDSLFENPKTKKRLAKGAVPDIPKQSQVTKAVASQVWGRLGALKIFDLRMREAAALMPVTRDCVIHSPLLSFCYHTKGNV